MSIRKRLIGGLLGVTALSLTGCMGLGLALVGNANSGTPLDVVNLDPNVPTVGGALEPGKAAVTMNIELPAASGYRTQHALVDMTRLAIGLIDVNADTTKLYFGKDQTGFDLLTTSLIPRQGATLFTGWAFAGAPSSAQLGNPKRYFYYELTSPPASSPRVVTFTNIKPGTRVIGFAAAFIANPSDASTPLLAGVRDTATPITVNPGLNNFAPIALTLDRNLGTVGATVSITPTTPTVTIDGM